MAVNDSGSTGLLPGERINWEPADESTAAPQSDSKLDEKYVRGEVRIVTEQGAIPVDEILTMVSGSKYELNPEFQRRRRWTVERQSRLIESLIINVPIPPIFLYEDSYNHFEVMDGLQRLTAIADFYAGLYPLTSLEEWPELNGRVYQTLPEQVRRGIDRRRIPTITLLKETASELLEAQRLKQVVFERINSGGIDLSPQESRNALYPGPMNSLCERLARNPSFCSTWGLPAPDIDEITSGTRSEELLSDSVYRRMDDVELVLRFFAHRQRVRLLKSGRLDRYLDQYLREANRFSETTLAALEALFVETIQLVFDVLGRGAFWLWRTRAGRYDWVERPTVVAYDPIMAGFSRMLDRGDRLREMAEPLRGSLPSFYETNGALFDGRKTNASDIGARDESFRLFLESFA